MSMRPLDPDTSIRLCIRVADARPDFIFPGSIIQSCDTCRAPVYFDPGQQDFNPLGVPLTVSRIVCTRCKPGSLAVLRDTLRYTNAFTRMAAMRRGRL